MDTRPTDDGWSRCALASAPAAGLRGRVLVAEDNRVHQVIVATMMKGWGLEVTLAMDGREAVSLATKSADSDRPDLVLMDLRMPEMDGYAATRQIRAWESQTGRNTGATRLPIIALTADAFDADRQRCLAAGMDAFLSKPINKRMLHAALIVWLRAAAR